MRPADSFIEQPVRSLQTMLRVLSEDDPKYLAIIPDGIYGATTMQAVSAFQRQNNLPVTGITDQVTWESIVTEYENAVIRVGKATPIEVVMDPGQIYRLGESGPYIFLLQSMLIQLSFDHPTIPEPVHNGTLDPLTAESIKAFQNLAGLPITGELDKVTWKHLVKQFALYSSYHKQN